MFERDATQRPLFQGFNGSKTMRKGTIMLLVVGTLLLAGCYARAGQISASEDQDKIVIIFKDGHQQSFRVADVARIEFSQSARNISTAGSVRFVGRWKVGDGGGYLLHYTEAGGKGREDPGLTRWYMDGRQRGGPRELAGRLA